MVDYAKKTVAELQEILKSRSLPSSGKKAELVARLTEADKADESKDTASAPAETAKAPPKQAAEPAPKPAPDNATEPAPQPAAVPASSDPIPAAPSTAVDTDTALAQSTAYALNLPQSDVDAEMAKRKARAERFGTGVASGEAESADAETQRNLERAKRFGTGQTAMGKLDEALSSEMERGARKRGRAEEGGVLDDPGLRRGFRGRGGGGRHHRGGRRDNSRRGDRPTGIQKPTAFTSEADRLAAEARKKKFATAS